MHIYPTIDSLQENMDFATIILLRMVRVANLN
jgi:hypothetical protein